jgi:hypothetical protein
MLFERAGLPRVDASICTKLYEVAGLGRLKDQAARQIKPVGLS